jgi:hypothetical protein
MSTDLIAHALHHDWPEVEAEVQDCRFIRAVRHSGASIGQPAYYAVGFTYQVKGITYKGVLNSPVEVQPHDKFPLRYNPEHPEQNNSLASKYESGWLKYYPYIFAALLIGFVVFDVVRSLFFRH